MNVWAERKLGSLIKIKHGFAFKGEYFSDSGNFVLLTPGNVYPSGGIKLKGEKEKYYLGEFPSDYLMKKNDLLVVMTDLTQTASILGGALLIPEDNKYLHNQRLGLVTIKDQKELDQKFLYCYLNWQYFRDQVKGSSNGATVKHTSPDRMYRCKINLPPYHIQQKIAAILSAYEDLIENNNKRIVLLEKAAEEIYREWFVRMRFPGWEQVKFVKGAPTDWKNTKFKNFCLLKRGYDLPNENIRSGIFPIIASTSIKAYHDAFMAEPPVITTGRSGSLGVVLFTNSRAWPLNTALYVKNYFGNSPYYVYYTLKYLGLEKFNSGAGVPTLNRNHLSGLDIAVPDKKLQNSFDEIIKPIFTNKAKLEGMNEKLKQSRDLLLSRLISGKLSVDGLDVRFPPSMTDEGVTAPA